MTLLLKALAILPDTTTVKRSAADREDLKPHWKSEICHNSIIYKFFKDFTDFTVVFSHRPFRNILKSREHQ